MKHFPTITKEIKNARLELYEIEAFDLTREAWLARRAEEHTKPKKKREDSLATSKVPTRKLQHTKTTKTR